MVNPVVAWFEFFLALWASLPLPIIAFFNLFLGCLVVSTVFRLVYTIRS